MKSVFVGVTVAVVIALGAAYVLDSKMQRSAEVAFQTQGVRL